MSQVLELTGWDGPGTRAGSLYAVPAVDRLAAARELAEAGWWIHVDVMSDGRGVTVAELARVRAAFPSARIEVHVIDLPPATGAPLPLADVLAARPDRVVLAAGRCALEGAAVRAGGAELWAEGHEDPVPARAGVEGVLVMLIDPGTTQSIDLSRLDRVAALPPGLGVGVDGGVGPQHVAALVRTGVQHLVSGRALLSQHHHSRSQQSARPHEQESHR